MLSDTAGRTTRPTTGTVDATKHEEVLLRNGWQSNQ